MNIKLWGRFQEERSDLLTRVAESRGHTVGRKAAVIFIMEYPHNIPNVQTALRSNGGGFVVAMRVTTPEPEDDRSFFKAGVYDVVNAPWNEDQAHQMFAEIEAEMAKIFGGRV